MQRRTPFTHYELLEIDKNATAQEIIAVCRRLLLIWHPDKAKQWAPEDSIKMCNTIAERINQARETLIDNRAAYNDEIDNEILEIEKWDMETHIKNEWNRLKEVHSAFLSKETSASVYVNYIVDKLSQIINTNTNISNNSNNTNNAVSTLSPEQLNSQTIQLNDIRQDLLKFSRMLEKSEFEKNLQAENEKLRNEIVSLNRKRKRADEDSRAVKSHKNNSMGDPYNNSDFFGVRPGVYSSFEPPLASDYPTSSRSSDYSSSSRSSDYSSSSRSSIFVNETVSKEKYRHGLVEYLLPETNEECVITLRFNSSSALQAFVKKFPDFGVGELKYSVIGDGNKVYISKGEYIERLDFLQVMVLELNGHFGLVHKANEANEANEARVSF